MFSPRTPAKSRGSVSLSQSHLKSRTSTPRRGSRSRNQSAFANQSCFGPQVIEETSLHRIETLGLTLPVLITETLTMSDRNTTEITACVDPSGWAWLVGGRKLFVWRYKSSGNARSIPACKELTLPPSDLAHSAERVCLIPSKNEAQPAAFVAVSPAGVVRYWPNIAFEDTTAEISAELKGEECAKVINFQPYGCLLATTTSSLLLLEPVPGQASIQCKPLKASQGIFSGIGRRMSSFIFGSSLIELNGATIVAGPEDEFDEDEDRRSFYVLSGDQLSKWQVPTIGTEKLLYQVDAERIFKDSLAKRVWDQECIQLPQLNTWLLDLQLTSEGIILLGAGVNDEADDTLYYALVYLETENDAPPSLQDFVLLDYQQKYSEETENQTLSYRLLLPASNSNIAFIYNSTSILMLTDKTALDKMDLKTSGDCLLGSGRADGLAVFFSNIHGIFSISAPRPEQSLLNESNNQGVSLSRTELSSVALNVSTMVEVTENSDKKSMLKNAFIAMISGNDEEAEGLIGELQDLATGHAQTDGAHGTELDLIVENVSKDLIDDFPNDPRWAESGVKDSSNSIASVIILKQLTDKQVAHDLFITFLKKYALWDQLCSVTNVHGNVLPTSLLLCEHVEKVEAAKGLRELHAEHAKLVDSTINSIIIARKLTVPKSLLPLDLFYREVSTVQDMLPELVNKEKELLSMDQPSHAVVSTILAVNCIMENMLHLALKYRQSNAEKYSSRGTQSMPEYIPWTSTSSVRDALVQQIELSLQRGISEAREVDVQGLLYQNIVGLADILMDGYATQLRFADTSESGLQSYKKLEKEFQKKRHSLIIPLLNHKQYDRAASLAEKYEDFEMLMRICDATGNQDRLQHYRTQYADKGFAQFLFNWYMKQGKRGHLLSQPFGESDELSRFLDGDNVKYLSWVHEIKRENFRVAQQKLIDLAKSETNYLSKKKTLLSLCKLASLASEEPDDNLEDNIEVIDEELDLILHQELLPPQTVQAVGMDPDNMHVLTPEELIELYVGEKNANGSELDVKKALDLLRHIDRDQQEDNYEQLKLHIWSRAILMDMWSDNPNEADPLTAAMDKIFFKTVCLFELDDNLRHLLPELPHLLNSPELAQINNKSHFKYLMQAGYEQIQAAFDG